jgi:cell division septal protein FtsQ
MLRKLLPFVLCLAAMGGLVWGLFGAETTQIHNVRIVGAERATEAQIRHLAALQPGTALVRLDLESAIEGVQKHPWVARATARRVFPDTVVIQIEERTVRALLMLERIYLVDSAGNPFKIASAPDLDHPTITGISTDMATRTPELARRIISDALEWLDALEGRASLGEEDISEVRFDAKSGYAIALRNGGEVRLGFRDHSVLNRLDSLLAQGVDLSRPHRVDLGLERIAVVSPL